jgi:XrtJ-associated TM-motif-TM protein
VYLAYALLMLASPLYAQDGSTDSLENPTVVLALLGAAGALFSTWRARRRPRVSRGIETPRMAKNWLHSMRD